VARPCTICTSDDRIGIESAVVEGVSHREIGRRFGFSASTVARHRQHAGLEPAPTTPNPSGAADAASALVATFRRQLGDKFSDQDAAEALQLESVAAALDADPMNVAILREFRISLASFRRAFDDGAPKGPSLAEFLADALGKSKGKSDG
jgi:hypothetical protein